MLNADIRKAENEKLFAIDWEGPFTLEELTNSPDDKSEGVNKWCLYAIHSKHPIYGPNSLTYIGMAFDQTVPKRLSQHKWWDETVLVGCIYNFNSWAEYYTQDYKHALEKTGEENKNIVAAIEALLIYSLAPAYNSRNKNSAVNATSYRIFNTGVTGAILPEISGFYNIEAGPEPEIVDEKAEN